MQETTALSTADAEYYSASMANCKVYYLRALLHRRGSAQKKPTPAYQDNTACIKWGNNVICGRERAKHIDIRNGLEALRARSHSEWSHAAGQGFDSGSDGRHPDGPDQGTTSSAGTRMRRWSPASAVNHKHLTDLCPQEEVGRQDCQVESRRPLRGVLRRFIGSRGPS